MALRAEETRIRKFCRFCQLYEFYACQLVKFVGSRFIKGYLFENQPEEEVIRFEEIIKLIIQISKKVGKETWKMLRVYSTITEPCMYNPSEPNRAIKMAIKEGRLKSNCSGDKIEEDVLVWSI